MSVDLRDVRARRDAAALFARQRSPRILASALVAATAARSVQRRPGLGDLRAAAGVWCARPLAEWLIHKHLLHAPARRIGGRSVDTASDHLRHHANPTDLGPVLLAPRFAVLHASTVAALCGGVSYALFRRRRDATTAACAAVASLALYEWTHFLIHTNVPARSRWLRNRRQHHRAHHYRDDTRFYGVTSDLADRLLATR